MDTEPYCCHIDNGADCTEAPTHTVWFSEASGDCADACPQHLAPMAGDSPVWVQPLEE